MRFAPSTGWCWTLGVGGGLIVVSLLGFLPSVRAGELRRMDNRDVLYRLPAEVAGVVDGYQVDPGRNAWLMSAWDHLGRRTVRTGRGLAWVYVPDTRRSEVQGYAWIEVEPLEGRTPQAAMAAFEERLPGLWDRLEIALQRVTSARDVKGMKVAGSSLSGRKVQQEVLVRRSGWKTQADTLLFALGDALVAVSSYGRSDFATDVVRGIRKADARSLERERSVRVLELYSTPPAASYLAFHLPPGFRHEENDAAEGDRTRVDVWRRFDAGNPGGEAISLRRVDAPRGLDPAGVMDRERKTWRADGVESEEPFAVSFDGCAASVCAYRVPSRGDTGARAGLFAVWEACDGYRSLRWERSDADEATLAPQRETVLTMLQQARIWSAPAGGT
jgi:hypothetical protein